MNTTSTPPAEHPFVYKLYLYRDRNDNLVFRAKWKWGPFWRWMKHEWVDQDWYGTDISEWKSRDDAMKEIREHARDRHQSMGSWLTLAEVEETEV